MRGEERRVISRVVFTSMRNPMMSNVSAERMTTPFVSATSNNADKFSPLMSGTGGKTRSNNETKERKLKGFFLRGITEAWSVFFSVESFVKSKSITTLIFLIDISPLSFIAVILSSWLYSNIIFVKEKLPNDKVLSKLMSTLVNIKTSELYFKAMNVSTDGNFSTLLNIALFFLSIGS